MLAYSSNSLSKNFLAASLSLFLRGLWRIHFLQPLLKSFLINPQAVRSKLTIAIGFCSDVAQGKSGGLITHTHTLALCSSTLVFVVLVV